MKKTIILSLCCLTALTVSAKASGPDATVLEILSFIYFIFGVLQIILFFKVWSMTNNVKKIKNSLAQDDTLREASVESKVRLLLLQDDKEAARRLLISEFSKTIEEIYNTMLNQGTTLDYIFEKEITTVVLEYEKRFQSIGLELPAYMKPS